MRAVNDEPSLDDLLDADAAARAAIARAGGLMSGPAIGLALGVSAPRVRQLVNSDPDFPAPLEELPGRPIWTAAAIRAWARRAGRPFPPQR
jgi:hypothetical protein